MRRSVWLFVVSVVALVGALMSPARASTPPESACAGPSDLGYNMIAGFCMSPYYLSGNTYTGADFVHVDFSYTKAHFVACDIYVFMKYAQHSEAQSNKSDCTKAANHRQDRVLPGSNPNLGCRGGEVIQGWMYVEFVYRADALKLHPPHHVTKSLPLAVTC